ncbi:helix-turn-helix domain-containing protein [Acidovorax facilis]|uniref:helix-turn-helix domain-containing protein n=1 Tax=Acidovorax facilis TaxID=12917 RepID=UPI003CEB420C
MKYLSPRSIPALSQLLPDLGDPSPREIARYLGVSERTVYHWKATDEAPRAALLALFWESSFGRSALDCELHNTAQVYRSLSESLNHEAQKLRTRIAWLEKNGRFDCSNQPFFPAVPVLQALTCVS